MSLNRKDCRDIWNAFMCEGAIFTGHDIPFCPTTALAPPMDIVTWDEAKYIYKHQLFNSRRDCQYMAYVCFYTDDYKFDGPKGIWNKPYEALKIIKHFAGAITPDFSTYQDFPEPIKINNTYKMRTFGYWLGKNGIPVINNVRWGTPETWSYCFNGIPQNSMVAIGTVGGSPRLLENRPRFEAGLAEMDKRLHPHTIVIYGSSNYPCFDKLKESGINIISYPSKTALAYERRFRDV
ncbi:MAG: DUF4417 domain-containing protein [Clostridia bacterium]|nr:DUF4417 domain-containing protein [Clostridia bacterium]